MATNETSIQPGDMVEILKDVKSPWWTSEKEERIGTHRVVDHLFTTISGDYIAVIGGDCYRLSHLRKVGTFTPDDATLLQPAERQRIDNLEMIVADNEQKILEAEAKLTELSERLLSDRAERLWQAMLAIFQPGTMESPALLRREYLTHIGNEAEALLREWERRTQ